MGHPYRQRHENGDFDKAAKQATTTNTGKAKQTTPKTTTNKPSK